MSNSEKWIEISIPNCNDKIEVSSFGQVRKTSSKGIVSILGGTISSGYRYVSICSKQYAVHHLVARAFIPNPNNYYKVIHKNGDRLDNKLENLDWSDKFMRAAKVNYAESNRNKLFCPELNEVFSSMRTATYVTGIPQDIISRAVADNQKICGLTFQWISSNEVKDGMKVSYIDFEKMYQLAKSSDSVDKLFKKVEKEKT